MTTCKKFRASHPHHLNPAGDCSNCMYFSAKNCGTHAGSAAGNADGSSFAFDM
jgi:hypothetical protein